MSGAITFEHRGRAFLIEVNHDGELSLAYGGVVRKVCPATGREPQYVWTNAELEWEEHHYIEVRYWASTGRVQVTVNREPALEQQLP